MWQTVLLLTTILCLLDEIDALRCPPLFLGSNCRSCYKWSETICDFERNVSYLHKDYQLFFEKEKLVFGHNIFEISHDNVSEKYSIFRSLPSKVTDLKEYMCSSINRMSNRCCNCRKQHAPSPYTYYGIPCTKCIPNSPGWLYYTLLELGFPTIMFIVFHVFRVRITSGCMVGFVFYCQAISYTFNLPFFYQLLTEKSRLLTNVLLTAYGVWNMDFFRLIIPRFCVSEHLGTLDVVALGYVSAFYPLVLTAMVYSLTKLHQRGCKLVVLVWKPFHKHAVRFRRSLGQNTSLVDVFATFLLLSYSKIIFVSLQVLQPLTFYVFNDLLVKTSVTKTSVDPQIVYFHHGHLVYAIPAIMILFTCGTIPIVILCLYPSRYARKIFSKCQLTASADFVRLVGAFQNSFKDGTNATQDYRAVSSIYVFHRVFLFLSFLTLKRHDFITNGPFILQSVVYIVTFAFYSYTKPYKSNAHNYIELVLLTLLTGQSVLNFKLYDGCSQYKSLVICSRQLNKLLTIQFCVLCIPQCALMMYMIWFLGKKVNIVSSRHLQALSFSLKDPTVRGYTSLSLEKQ